MATQINLDIATRALLTNNDGNSISLTMAIKDADEAPVSMAGHSFTLRIWGSYKLNGQATKTTVDEEIDGVVGGDNLSVTFTKEDTSVIKLPRKSEGQYEYNYTIVRDIAGEKAVILEGEYKRKNAD